MGKYSNINAKQLYDATVKAISELNTYNFKDEISILNNKNNLNSVVSNKVNDSLDNITNSISLTGSIATIKKLLEKLKNGASYIIKYQEVERDLENLEERLDNYEENRRLINLINSKQRLLDDYLAKIDYYLS